MSGSRSSRQSRITNHKTSTRRIRFEPSYSQCQVGLSLEVNLH